MTNFRILCTELVEDIEEWMKGTDHYPSGSVELVNRARTVLAQLKPQMPTDKELDAFIDGFFLEDDWFYIPEMERNFARAVLAHWGNQ